MKIFKKLAVGISVAALMLSPSLCTHAEENRHLLFSMDFNNRDTTADVGEATLKGSLSYEKGSDGTYAARFDNPGNYLILTNSDGTSLLSGKDEITISFKKKADTATSWLFYSAPDDKTQTYENEHYIGILDNGTKITAERYNGGKRTSSAEHRYSQGEWQDITLIIGKKSSTLYVDGKAVSEKFYTFTPSEILGTSPITYIGKANWGSGEWASAVIDDIRIFDIAPTVTLQNLTNVKEDITLPVAAEETDGYSISWSSSDESVITSTGKIMPPELSKKTVTLTATIKFDQYTLTKDFTATVMPQEAIKNIVSENDVLQSVDISLPPNEDSANLYISEYDTANNLSGVKLFNIIKSGIVDINYKTNGGIVKLMLWDKLIEPLSEAITVLSPGTTRLESIRIQSYYDDRGKIVSLAPRSGNHSANVPIVVWEYDVYEHHTWLGHLVDDNTYQFESRTGQSGFCMASSDDNIGDEIILKPKDTSDTTQLWVLESAGDGFYRLRNKGNNMYLTTMRVSNYSMYKDSDIRNHTVSADHGTNVTMANCVLLPLGANTDESQMWKFDVPEE